MTGTGPPVPNRVPGLREALILAAILAPFLAWLAHALGADLWYDEAFTLTNYVLVPLRRTVTDYSFPNNHIFFSLLTNAWLKLIRVQEVAMVLEQPWLIRVIPLAATLGTAANVYAIGRRRLGRFRARVALLVLVTALPFAGFALQARGWSLSLFLLTALLYHALGYEDSGRRVHALLITVAAALALYTIPLNLYFAGALAVTMAALGLAAPRSAPERPRRLAVAALVAAGCALALLLYLPVLRDLFGNRFVAAHGPFHLPTLARTLPAVLGAFVSGRWLLLLVFAVGIVPVVARAPAERRLALLLAGLLLLPFVASFARGDRPYERVFLNTLPAFALLIGLGSGRLAGRVPGLRGRPWLALLVLALYCHGTFLWMRTRVSARLLADIEQGRKSQSLALNYYADRYRPRAVVLDLAARVARAPAPVVVLDADVAALPLYLDAAGLDWYGRDAFGPALAAHERLYVVTAFPGLFRAEMARSFPGLRVEQANARPDFHATFVLTRPAP